MQVCGQLTSDQLVVDIPRAGAIDHRFGQVDSDEAPRVRRDERTAEPGAAAGIEYVEASRRADAPRASPPRAPALDTTSCASLASKLAAKLSNVLSMNASDARVGTSRPEQAASMCRAIGSSGSSRSHSSKTADRLVDFTERVVRERQQPSRLRMPRPERDDLGEAASRLRVAASGRSAERRGCCTHPSGRESMRMAARYAASASTNFPLARSTTPRLL